MADWGYALGRGIAAGAQSGVESIEFAQKQQATIDAEQRAADRQLDTAERMVAIKEALQQRADERYTAIVKQKQGEPVPVAAPSVDQTGLTRDSAAAAGLTQGGIAGDKPKIDAIIETAQATLQNPTATKQQKEDAAALIEQLNKQKGAQGELNAKSVEGKTRTRTTSEAHKAALDWASVNDPTAYRTGMGMLESELKNEHQDKRDDLATRKEEARAAMMAKTLEAKERIAAMSVSERANYHTAETERKAEADAARATSGGRAGSNKETAVEKNVRLLRSMGVKEDEVVDYALGRKPLNVAQLATRIQSNAKKSFEDITPEQAVAQAQQMADAVKAANSPTGAKAVTVPNPTQAGAPKRLKYNPATGKVE